MVCGPIDDMELSKKGTQALKLSGNHSESLCFLERQYSWIDLYAVSMTTYLTMHSFPFLTSMERILQQTAAYYICSQNSLKRLFQKKVIPIIKN